jgi:hypothetical protein
MRSGFSEGLMGVGGIFLSFGFTIIVIGLFARMNTNTQAELPAITKLATIIVGAGAVMFVAGYLLSRIGRGGNGYRDRERVTP